LKISQIIPILNPRFTVSRTAELQYYLDLNHDSGVANYEIGREFIRVQFRKKSKIYTYSYASAGYQHVENMKQLAQYGDGLNAYINHHTRQLFVR
jgi:hypothetical protein